MNRSSTQSRGQPKTIPIPEPFLAAEGPETPTLQFHSESSFTFPSFESTPWRVNNVVHGKLFPSVEASQGKPTVVLLHGWNAEHCYYYLFPWIARRLERRGIATAVFELPYHCHRRPRDPGAIHDFISSDLASMIQAVRQAVADTRSLAAWLVSTRREPVVVWGFSLGAWLAGLTASVESSLGAAVLTTPIAQMDRAIQDLDFCAPVRSGLQGTSISLAPFSLAHYRPLLPPDRILIMAARHDEFVTMHTLEDLRAAWNGPQFWTLPHSHISILMALPTLRRTIDWISSILSYRPCAKLEP